MNVLVISSTFPTFISNDTTPPFVFDLTHKMAETSSIQFTVLTPYRRGSSSFEIVDNIPIYRFHSGTTSLFEGGILVNLHKSPLLWLIVPYFLASFLWNMKRIIKKTNIKIIHAHWILPQGLLALLYKIIFDKNIKILTTIHGADIFSLQSRLFQWLKKIILLHSDYITSSNHVITEEIRKMLPENFKSIEIAPMSVDETIFTPERRDATILKKFNIRGSFILFVGRLEEKKGLKYVLLALPLVLQKYPTTKLCIIGDGTLRQDLELLVKKLSIENNVIFVGALSHVSLPPYFATADIVVVPSVQAKNGDREGLPVVIFEAMLSKTALIVSKEMAFEMIINHGRTGLLVDVHDSDKLTQAIIHLIENVQLRKKLGIEARQYVLEHYTLQHQAKKYIRILESLQQVS